MCPSFRPCVAALIYCILVRWLARAHRWHYHLCSCTRAHAAPRSATSFAYTHTCLLASVLQAASARDFLNAGALEAAPRGRDLLKLAHCRTDSSPARPTKTSNWEAGRGCLLASVLQAARCVLAHCKTLASMPRRPPSILGPVFCRLRYRMRAARGAL